MEKREKLVMTFFILVFLIAALYFFTNWFSIVTGYFSGESEQEGLVKCLNNQGAEFYGSDYCSDCELQRNEFGRVFAGLKHVDCGADMENCPNIRSIPAWYVGNEVHYGFKTLEELKELSGCG